MSFFQGSSNVAIRNLNLIFYESPVPESPRDHLYSKVVCGAIHDSEERCDAPKCHPETRKAVQEGIMGWIRGGDDPMKVMWITGPAGSGKTAIAGSIAESCDGEGLLAATFFFSSFSGAQARCLKHGFIATLVSQLIQLDDTGIFEGHVFKAIQRNPTIFERCLKKQMETLILTPLRNLHKLPSSHAIAARVIIIDGLDEVEHPESRQVERQDARPRNEAEQVEILSALHYASNDPIFPFRIVVASRPERVIQGFFSRKENENNHKFCRKICLHDQHDANADIRLFLDAKFAEIRRRYQISSSWPSESSVERLVDTASGQFIYAATVIRFLQDDKIPDPQGRLRTVLDLGYQSAAMNPLGTLDALYTRILMSSPDPLLAARWVGAIDCFSEPDWFMRHLLQEFEGQAAYLLENLASLIKAPQAIENYGDSIYELYHKSLPDFLRSERCGRDLRAAFKSGDSLRGERIEQVLRAKSTNTPLPAAHLPNFLRLFIDALQGELRNPVDSLWEGLGSCDVIWWVHTIASVLWDENHLGVENHLGLIFWKVHKRCKGRASWGFRDCLDTCKHWRGNMIRACSALGWDSPDAVELLKEKLDLCYFDGGFQRPTCQFKCSNRKWQVCPPVESLPATIFFGSSMAEYERICDTAALMLSRLPSDWKSLCATSIKETYGAAVFWALPDSVRDGLLDAPRSEIWYVCGDDGNGLSDDESLGVGRGSRSEDSDASVTGDLSETDDEDQYESADEGA